jgi:hypothetical protein
MGARLSITILFTSVVSVLTHPAGELDRKSLPAYTVRVLQLTQISRNRKLEGTMGLAEIDAYIDDLKGGCRIIEQQDGLLPSWEFVQRLESYAEEKYGTGIDLYAVSQIARRFVRLRESENRGNIIDWEEEF